MNLKGQNIVIFSLFRFDAEIESTSFTLAKQLAVDNQVYYFDNPFTINDLIRRRKSDVYKKRRGLFGILSDKSISIPGSSVEIFIPPVVPSIHFLPEGRLYRHCLKISESLIRQKIRHVLAKRQVTDLIFINSFNFHYPGVAAGLAARLRVYHCLDPIIGAFDGRHGLLSERELVEGSDLVICSSKQLFTEKRAVNPNTHFVPNAADPKHSQKALDPNLPVSSLLVGVAAPIVGYLGSIDHRMDFSLLAYLAQKHPDKSFVLVGPRFVPLPEVVKKANNVYFPGKVGYPDMPRVLKGFDVCIIPFVKDDHSATVFPLKLFEYLGTGKPVVISDFNPDLRDFTFDSVAICRNPAAFSEALTDALEKDSEALRKARRDIAARNTWQHRAKAIADLLAGAIDQRR